MAILLSLFTFFFTLINRLNAHAQTHSEICATIASVPGDHQQLEREIKCHVTKPVPLPRTVVTQSASPSASRSPASVQLPSHTPAGTTSIPRTVPSAQPTAVQTVQGPRVVVTHTQPPVVVRTTAPAPVPAASPSPVVGPICVLGICL